MVLTKIKNKILFWSKFLKKDLSGFTLLEIMVAVAIFIIIVGAAMGVFVWAINSQRKIMASQELLDQTSYNLEYMGRALRMAKKDKGPDCLTQVNLNYEKTDTGEGGIKFKSYEGEYCLEFYKEWDGVNQKYRLKEIRTEISSGLPVINYLTPPDSNVISFKVVSENGWDQNDNLQPAVTIFLEVEGKEESKIKIQTTISKRDLDVAF